MPALPKARTELETTPPKCLARSVVQALSEEPTLEAVTIDRTHHTISVATLGQADVPKLTARISDTLQEAQQTAYLGRCLLLSGKDDCRSCEHPLTELERKRITIQHGPCTTTIARVTCP